jgi:hypothetical protein
VWISRTYDDDNDGDHDNGMDDNGNGAGNDGGDDVGDRCKKYLLIANFNMKMVVVMIRI